MDELLDLRVELSQLTIDKVGGKIDQRCAQIDEVSGAHVRSRYEGRDPRRVIDMQSLRDGLRADGALAFDLQVEEQRRASQEHDDAEGPSAKRVEDPLDGVRRTSPDGSRPLDHLSTPRPRPGASDASRVL